MVTYLSDRCAGGGGIHRPTVIIIIDLLTMFPFLGLWKKAKRVGILFLKKIARFRLPETNTFNLSNLGLIMSLFSFVSIMVRPPQINHKWPVELTKRLPKKYETGGLSRLPRVYKKQVLEKHSRPQAAVHYQPDERKFCKNNWGEK